MSGERRDEDEGREVGPRKRKEETEGRETDECR